MVKPVFLHHYTLDSRFFDLGVNSDDEQLLKPTDKQIWCWDIAP
jgi:hypothetical protein